MLAMLPMVKLSTRSVTAATLVVVALLSLITDHRYGVTARENFTVLVGQSVIYFTHCI